MKFIFLGTLMLQSIAPMPLATTRELDLSSKFSPNSLSIPPEIIVKTSLFLDQSSFDGLLKLFKSFYPGSNPLQWETDNPLALHNATKDGQAALAQWLRMPMDAPEKKFWLQQLMLNPTVDFNFQNKLKVKVKDGFLSSLAQYDPRRLTCLDHVLTHTILIRDKESFSILLERGIMPDVRTQKEVLMSGDMKLSKLVFQLHELNPNEYLIYAIKSGSKDLLKFLLKDRNYHHDKALSRLIVGEAAKHGKLSLITYFLEERNDTILENSDDQMNVLIDASGSGDLQIIIYLLNYWKISPNDKCLYHAVRKGSLDTIKYFVETKELVPNLECIITASSSGNLEVARYIVEYWRNHLRFSSPIFLGSSFGPDVICLNQASKSGNIELVKYFIEECHVLPNQETLQEALHEFNPDLIRYLTQIYGLKTSDKFMEKAAKLGDISLINYLHDYQYLPITENTILSSCSGGQLETFQYLVQKSGIEPNISCLESAAKSGNLKLVKHIVNQYHISPTFVTLNETEIASSNNYMIDYSELKSYLANCITPQNHARSVPSIKSLLPLLFDV
jgi:ankyrin repeat protein